MNCHRCTYCLYIEYYEIGKSVIQEINTECYRAHSECTIFAYAMEHKRKRRVRGERFKIYKRGR